MLAPSRRKQPPAPPVYRCRARAIASLVVLALFVLGLSGFEEEPKSVSPQPSADATNAAPRQVYPMSVIPGGAYSKSELQQRVEADPVAKRSLKSLAAHLKDPELLDHVRAVKVPRDTALYTQLRAGNRLLWSERPVVVRAGETAFVDEKTGKMVARARCGNALLSSLPPGAATGPPPPNEMTGTEKSVDQSPKEAPKGNKAKKRISKRRLGGSGSGGPSTDGPPPRLVWELSTPKGEGPPARPAADTFGPSPAAAFPVSATGGHITSGVTQTASPGRKIPWGVLIPPVVAVLDDDDDDEPPPVAVPEPGSWLLMAVSLGGAVLFRGRRARRKP